MYDCDLMIFLFLQEEVFGLQMDFITVAAGMVGDAPMMVSGGRGMSEIEGNHVFHFLFSLFFPPFFFFLIFCLVVKVRCMSNVHFPSLLAAACIPKTLPMAHSMTAFKN